MNFKHKKLIIALEIIFLVVFFWWFGTFKIKINCVSIANDKIKNNITFFISFFTSSIILSDQ